MSSVMSVTDTLYSYIRITLTYVFCDEVTDTLYSYIRITLTYVFRDECYWYTL